ncbi:MAG: 3-oxoacid CoA-transferase subunit A [Nocardiopsaceae bacterium]|nr:3-oxoacid CoA-transferase subunit A [Nocardiopsaceae bacterium]
MAELSSKVLSSAAEAVADIPDGASIALAGFGVSHRYPSTLITALADHGARDLTVYCNGLGQPGFPTGTMLADNHQISRLVTCFSARPGFVSEAEKQIQAGEMELEMIAQGTLVERMRAGGAGIPAFYTPTGYGSAIASGKDIRYFDGRPYVLERAITTDYALLRAQQADGMGNLRFWGGSQNFNVSFAKAARVAIVEAEEIVPVGAIPPDAVDLPGVFVARVVPITVRMDVKNLPMRANRPPTSARSYHGKQGLTREQVGRRVAALLPDEAVVNLGAGMPVQVANFVASRPVVLHAENGMLNYGGFDRSDDFDPDLHDAGGQFVTLRDGTSFFDSVTSFEIARGGRLYAVVLGTYQVGANGDLANWSAPGQTGGGIGGAMDLCAGAQRVIAMCEHTDSRGNAKLVASCAYPVTAPGCVDVIVTDLALLRRPSRSASGFVLEEIASGFTVDEVLSLTGMPVTVANPVGVLQENWL